MKVKGVYTIIGEKVQIDLSTNEIDLTKQPNGVYFIRFDKNSTVKVIKQ